MKVTGRCTKGLCLNASTRFATYLHHDGKPVAVQESCDECGGPPFFTLTDERILDATSFEDLCYLIDPNEALKKAREALVWLRKGLDDQSSDFGDYGEDTSDLVEAFEALDALSEIGVVPDAWKK